MRPSPALLVSSVILLACTETPEPAPATESPRPPAMQERQTPPLAQLPQEPTEVEFTSSDGFTILGTLTPGQPASPAVILVHQLHSSRSEWAPLIERLHAEPALTVLAIDLRGHGQSHQGPAGAVELESFDSAGWASLSNDVLAAVAYLRTEPHGLSPQRIALVGSSIGSSAVILAAAADPSLDTIVALSPGRAYRGVDAITPAMGLGRRHLLSIAASGEADSVETGNAFARITSGEALVLDGSDHGVALFTTHPEALERIDSFLRAPVATR